MTSSIILSKSPAVAGKMADGHIQVITATTTVDTYEIMGTYQSLRTTGNMNTFMVTGNDMLVKVEITRDDLIWYTMVEDYLCVKNDTTQMTHVTPALRTRISVKPAVAGQHGTVVWTNVTTEITIDPSYRTAFTYEPLVVTSAAPVGLTKAIYDGAYVALITVEDNPVRVRYDGVAPTPTEGHYLSPGDIIRLDFSIDIWKFKAIATTGDAKLKVTYSR
jgi:hypothetical protein